MITLGSFLEKTYVDRCGTILYTIIDGKRYFLLTIDRSSGEFADFGGGIKMDEYPIDGVVRELKEESSGIFCLRKEHFAREITLVNETRDMAIVLTKVDSKWLQSVPHTLSRKNKEISGLRWVTEQDLHHLIKGEKVEGRKMWERLRQFLEREYKPFVGVYLEKH